MLYDSDLSNLLSQWQEIADRPFVDSSYKDGVRDCIYDLKTLIDKQFQEECLANEAFEQRIKKDEKYWNEYFDNLLADGMFA
jgi:hypothetical protein